MLNTRFLPTNLESYEWGLIEVLIFPSIVSMISRLLHHNIELEEKHTT